MNYTERNKLADKLCGIGIMLIFVEICISMIKKMCFDAMYARNTMGIIGCVAGGIFLVISVALYVMAYKKSSASKAVWATEFAALAFTLPFFVHICVFSKSDILRSIPVQHIWLPFLVYYIVKAIYVIIAANKKSSVKKRKK